MNINLWVIQEWLNLFQSLFTIVALFVGGIWFWKRRRHLPKSSLSHEIVTRPLGDEHVLLRVTAVLTNSGDVLIPIRNGCTRVSIIPGFGQDSSSLFDSAGALDRDEWTSAKFQTVYESKLQSSYAAEVEPTEVERFSFDFALPRALDTVLIRTNLDNEAKGNSWWRRICRLKAQEPFTWELETIYDIPRLDSYMEIRTAKKPTEKSKWPKTKPKSASRRQPKKDKRGSDQAIP